MVFKYLKVFRFNNLDTYYVWKIVCCWYTDNLYIYLLVNIRVYPICRLRDLRSTVYKHGDKIMFYEHVKCVFRLLSFIEKKSLCEYFLLSKLYIGWKRYILL